MVNNSITNLSEFSAVLAAPGDLVAAHDVLAGLHGVLPRLSVFHLDKQGSRLKRII